VCGIYGISNKNKPPNVESSIRSRDLLSHRGPDDAGIWLSRDRLTIFGHRRLSIIDLTSAGHQPMLSNDGSLAIVFNGEIYNFQSIRSELIRGGYHFHSESDTEVILASYRVWGELCVDHFNGMFAFAIYDAGTTGVPPSIFFARDRVGKKPFYYLFNGDTFEFASELKSISHNGDVSLIALNYYLALGYIPGEHCFIQGVKKLPPAHAGRLDLTSFNLNIWKYWKLPENQMNTSANGEDLADEAEDLLSNAVGLRMVSDVPLGVLLSGGLDSSLIAAIAARKSTSAIKTFTLSLPGSKLDEGAYAKCVASHFSTDHHVLELGSPSLGVIEDLAPFIDEPLADSSMIPSYLISKLTRQFVTVALGGDGGDELFGGYSEYLRSLSLQKKLAFVPHVVLNSASELAGFLPAGVKGRNRLHSLRDGALKQQIWGTPYFDSALRTRILNHDALQQLNGRLLDPEHSLLDLFNEGKDGVDCMTRSHFGSALPDDFLVKIDRTSMAASLELRTPFLDYRLVEFAFSKIPSNWKVGGGETRRLERVLASRLLPPQLDINRKQGFSIPMDDWMRADKCEMVRSYMRYLPNCINRREIENLIAGLAAGRANGGRLFALLLLGIAMKNMGIKF
jgi:asparagine synthase (glutamine-hydrolysing)